MIIKITNLQAKLLISCINNTLDLLMDSYPEHIIDKSTSLKMTINSLKAIKKDLNNNG